MVLGVEFLVWFWVSSFGVGSGFRVSGLDQGFEFQSWLCFEFRGWFWVSSVGVGRVLMLVHGGGALSHVAPLVVRVLFFGHTLRTRL